MSAAARYAAQGVIGVRCFISGSIVSVSLDDMARVWTAIGEGAHVGPAVRDPLRMRRVADNRDGQNRNQN